MIAPHGGRLINRMIGEAEREALEREVLALPRITLTDRETADLEMLAVGALSPLEGFMTREDYECVLNRGRLALGLPWTIPITLAATEAEAAGVEKGGTVALADPGGRILAIMEVEDRFRPDKDEEAKKVLLTTDASHPGVGYLRSVGDIYLGGPVSVLHRPPHEDFVRFRLDPKETRLLFKLRGWGSVAAFQTRNPIHRAHEYLQKCALEMVDGLLIHPLVGATRQEDIPAEVRMRCYQVLLEGYYPPSRTVLAVFPAAMRYAGPREAIFHALVRKNYGCTHFIVGRDHAGVGTFYGTYDAHYIFREFDPEEIGITPLFFDNAFYCRRCGSMASTKTCPHGGEEHVSLSGTKLRELLSRGEMPPLELTRAEVAQVLMEHMRRAAAGSGATKGAKE